MNMTLVNFGTERDWRGLFFVAVFVLTKMLLLNIFQGFFIAIFLQFYGKQEMHEVKKKAPKVVTKKDFRFEMAKFFVKKSGRKVVEETEGGDGEKGKKEGGSEDKKNK